jgi:hypothetical protein
MAAAMLWECIFPSPAETAGLPATLKDRLNPDLLDFLRA